jgi:hypothetical protein
MQTQFYTRITYVTFLLQIFKKIYLISTTVLMANGIQRTYLLRTLLKILNTRKAMKICLDLFFNIVY